MWMLMMLMLVSFILLVRLFILVFLNIFWWLGITDTDLNIDRHALGRLLSLVKGDLDKLWLLLAFN